MLRRISAAFAILVLAAQPALAEPLATYMCYVYSYGHEDYVRQIKLQPNGRYDAWANAVAGLWGESGSGQYSANGDGTVTFYGGPLQDAEFTEVSGERPFADYFTVTAPNDDRGTMCKAL